MSKTPILYCDIDSTINDHWKRIKRHSVNGVCDWSRAFSQEEIMKDLPLPGAKDAIEFLSSYYDIVFLTARSFDNAYDITKAWLDEHDFIYNKIIVVKKSIDKLEYVINTDCIFIDDLSRKHESNPPYTVLYENTIQQLEKHKVKYIRFKGDWAEILNAFK